MPHGLHIEESIQREAAHKQIVGNIQATTSTCNKINKWG
jgi:hypothetical protein